ncbi:filament-like plant protein [Andrographis paniculata]|uniref:filament-like plant protein n=1 Tax=Andrographis paniculata TaxID=175694 RepID=UPI0021E8E175|nr:filament-like plant protein [Andrographis paniculata]
MDKRKWLWKRKSSEISPSESESESNGSSFSHSDEQQEGLRQSPQVISIPKTDGSEMEETIIKTLTEKLSAALVNISANEELVKQHTRVAEEAVAGWEKTENEVAALKQQLDVAVQHNLSLEVRASHLESALRECVRQLRQARDDATPEKNGDWESQKIQLEKQILHLQAQVEVSRAENSAAIDPDTLLVIEALEKENTSLRQELMSRHKQLEVIAIERDLSTEAAETASKLQLASIKKVAKLQTECRMLRSMVRRSSTADSNHKFAAASSSCAVTDGLSECGSRQKSIDLDTEETVKTGANGYEPTKNLSACCLEIDMMDDFLEMERLAGLSETNNIISFSASELASGECVQDDNVFKDELNSMAQQVAELGDKATKLEAEKLRLQNALDESVDHLKTAQSRVAETETTLEELQKDLAALNETKVLLESQLVAMETEASAMSSNINSLKAEIEDERKLSSELAAKCEELERELTITIQEKEVELNKSSNGETRLKQEDLAVASDKLAECQKTIASLGRQLQSLAALEDFLIDTSNIPGPSEGALPSGNGGEFIVPTYDLAQLKLSIENYRQLENRDSSSSRIPPPSALSTSHTTAAKNLSSFGRIFSRSKSVIELGNTPD